MGRLRLNASWSAVAILCFLSLSVSGCGGGKKAGTPLFPGRVTLSPATTSSLVLGGTLNFSASAATASGTNIATPISFASSNTSILTLAPNGVACAGQWDVNFTACTPGNSGPVTVTASALGANSIPVYVFVHPPIDSITVNGILLNGLPVQEPCLSQTQSMSVEAHAFSQGTDITSSVGPFTFSATSTSVVNLVSLVNSAYNFPTNQATATALAPGMTQIFASASGVSSTTFQQPQYQNSLGATSPALDFFETCPIQSIALQVGSGTQQSGQTTFVTDKGTGQTATAVLTDVMGNTSLPNTNGGIVLSKISLTWTSSQPGVLSAPSGCFESCALTTPAPGSGSVTASCSPPTCNIGFPLVPASLSTTAQIDACNQFFQPQYPNFTIGCQALIPAPVYADPLPSSFNPMVPGDGWISGIVTGAPVPATVLATSTGCAHSAPAICVASIYSLSTAKASTGPANPIPTAPNSLLFDATGDKAYMGSDFGAQLVNPANFGGNTSPFTSLGTVTGTVLAVSNNGSFAVFSDLIHTPNQIYVVNTSNATAATATTLNISGAVAAAFSPDALKTFIIGCVSSSVSSIPCSSTTGNALYVYSPLQALQGPIVLSGSANSVAFSPNGAFAYVAETSTTGSQNLTAFATCNNQLAASLALPANPILMKVIPNLQLNGRDTYGNTIPDGIHVLILDATGFDIVSSIVSPATTGLCPQTLTFVSDDPSHLAQRIELEQGTLQPVNFFPSADASQLYIATANNASILVYDFGTNSVSGIQLLGNAIPVTADISIDDGTIAVSGSDGLLHQITTEIGGSDQVQLAFPDIPNYLNPFCTFAPTTGPCTLNLALVRP